MRKLLGFVTTVCLLVALGGQVPVTAIDSQLRSLQAPAGLPSNKAVERSVAAKVAASLGTEASVPAVSCAGWKIRSAGYITGTDFISTTSRTWGAVQLLRNYCTVIGADDYTAWMARGFTYHELREEDGFWCDYSGTEECYDYGYRERLVAYLRDSGGVVTSCTLESPASRGHYCTTRAAYNEPWSNGNQHNGLAYVHLDSYGRWPSHSGGPCGGWSSCSYEEGAGQTAKIYP